MEHGALESTLTLNVKKKYNYATNHLQVEAILTAIETFISVICCIMTPVVDDDDTFSYVDGATNSEGNDVTHHYLITRERARSASEPAILSLMQKTKC